MIRNTIEELVYRLFKNNSTYSTATASGASGSADVEMMEEKDSSYKLSVQDVLNLFQEL